MYSQGDTYHRHQRQVSTSYSAHGVSNISTADGLDDFICIAKDGTACASINNGDGNDSAPIFKSIGLWKEAVPRYDQSHVVIGDVDGDGRGDYCVIEDNGDMQCWRIGWIGE